MATFTIGPLTYVVNDAILNNVTITACSQSTGTLNIISPVIDPNTSISYNVTIIGTNAFSNKSISSFTLPDSLTSISNYGFAYNTTFTSILLKNVTAVSSYAFSGCSGLTDISLNNVSAIGQNVFSGCRGLTTISIPNATSIGTNAFINCSNLQNFAIPDSIVTLGNSVFNGCSKLTSVLYPTTYRFIATNMFKDCTSLSTISYDYITSIDPSAFQGCTGLTSVTFPNVTVIGVSSFQGCTNLTTINFPKSTSIGANAFSGCTSLNNITIPSSVTGIGTNVFTNNNSSITFQGIPTNINIMNVTSSSFTLSSNFTFNNVSSSSDILTTALLYQNYPTQVQNATYLLVGCFLHDSKVLTDSQMVCIQDLIKGDLVQTLNHGLLPIKFVGKRSIYNYPTEERTISHLYKLNKKDFPELKEDLYITGGHPLLMNNLNEETKNKLLDMAEMGTPIITEGKYRVFAMLHPKAELWNEEGMKEIYDIVLENEDPHCNYGIWVNGILTESMDEHFFLNYSGMMEINK
jgi:hypothetical protein